MSLINYSKYKISIDPGSKKIQGLQPGDIVRRQYFDGKNLIYTLMAVLETGVDDVIDDNKNKAESPYFIGALLDGDIPSSDQVLDFVRMTSLYDKDRSGALYLTASDSEAPYMSVIDKMGYEKAIRMPYEPNDKMDIDNPDQYTSYVKYKDGVYNVFTLSDSKGIIKFSFTDNLKIGERILISFKARNPIDSANTCLKSDFSFGYADNSGYDAQWQDDIYGEEWKYYLKVINIDTVARNSKSFSVKLVPPIPSIEIGELNIIRLSDVGNFYNANKAIIGKIGQIVDPVFGTLKGYGVYSQNLYATRNVAIAGTLTAGDENGFSSTFYAGKIQKNMILNSMECDFQGTADIVSNEPTPARIGNVYRFTTDNFHDLVCRDDRKWTGLHRGETVTFSIWIKGTSETSLNIYQNSKYIDTLTIKEGWARYSLTFQIKKTADLLTMRFETSIPLLVCSPQLEFGESVTQYQPTDGKLSDDTQSYGMWACRGGFGGTIQNPLLKMNSDGSISSRNDSFVINNDGTGYFSGGKFRWTKDDIILQGVTIRWEDLDPGIQDQLTARSVSIEGDTVFLYNGSTPDKKSVTLRGIENNLQPIERKWQCQNDNGTWKDLGYLNSLTFEADNQVWEDRKSVVIKYIVTTATGKEYSDTISVFKVYDGINGLPGKDGVDGKTTYTWIRYADDERGSGISNNPTGKEYIGFAYNKTTSTESNIPSDYTWSLIKGTDGIPGEPGKDGNPTYTWIKYSDYPDGTGMYDIPTDQTVYIGIATNKDTEKEGNNKQDYTWSKFKGEDGSASYKSTVFKRSNDKPSIPTGGSYASPTPSGWSDGIPDGESILWASTRIFTSDGKAPQQSTWTTPRQMTDTADFDVEFSSVANPSAPSGHPNTNTQWSNAQSTNTIWMATSTKRNGVWSAWSVSKIKGETGKEGTGISSIEELYAVSSSKNTPPSGWYGNMPEMTPTNKYLWNKERIYLSDGTTKESVQIIGVYGDTGVAGNGISSITNYYLATTASSGVTTSTPGWSTSVSSQTINTSKPYLWGYEKITYTNGTSKTTQPHVIGHFGKDGQQGIPGKDANLLEWVKDWDSNKTVIDGESVITPKIFAGTKNSDGTLTGLTLGSIKTTTKNPNGSSQIQTVNGIYGFNKGKNTWFFDTLGNAQIGFDKSYIKYNSSTGKVEFGPDVKLEWSNMEGTVPYDSFDNQINNTDFKHNESSTGEISYSGVTIYGNVSFKKLLVPLIMNINIDSASDTSVTNNCLRFSTNKICNPASLKFSIYNSNDFTSYVYVKFGDSADTVRKISMGKKSWVDVEIENVSGMDSSYIYIGFSAAGNYWIMSNSMILTNSTTAAKDWKLSPGDLKARTTKITQGGIYTGTLNAEQVVAGIIQADAAQIDSIQSTFITANYIDTLMLNSKQGKIGGWTIDSNSIYIGTKQSSNAFTTSGITIYSGDNNGAIRSRNFRIDTDGSAYFNGTITATSGSIGGWKINTSSITKNNVTLGSDGSITNGTKWKLNNDGSGQLANGKISWNSTGDLSINAQISTTKINAVEGTIGKWKISKNSIYTGTEKTSDGFSASGITLYSDGSSAAIRSPQFRIDTNGNAYFKGQLEAANGSFSGTITSTSGKIGGWNIGLSYIYNGNMYLYSSGSIQSIGKWILSKDNGLTMYNNQAIKSQKDSSNYVKMESGYISGSYETIITGSDKWYSSFELNVGDLFESDSLSFLKLETSAQISGTLSKWYTMEITSQTISIKDDANQWYAELYGNALCLRDARLQPKDDLIIRVGLDYLYGTLYVDSNGYVRSR